MPSPAASAVGTNPGPIPVLLSRPAWPSSLRAGVEYAFAHGHERLHHLQRQERVRRTRARARLLRRALASQKRLARRFLVCRSPFAARVELGRLLRPLRQRLRTPHQGLLRQSRPPRVVHLAGDRIHPAPVPVGRDEVAPPQHRRLLRELGQTFLLRLARLVLARLAAHRGLGSAGLAAAHPAELKRALAGSRGMAMFRASGAEGPSPFCQSYSAIRASCRIGAISRFRLEGLVSSSYTRCGPSLGSQSTMTRRGRTRSRPRPPGHRGEGVRRSTIARAKRVPSSLRATKHAAVEIEVTSSRHEECFCLF